MMRRTSIVILFIWMLILLPLNVSLADDAEVLPKGVSKTNLKWNYYFPFDKRFDQDGNEEDLAVDFNANLNSSVFPGLEMIEAAFFMPPGSASLGDSVVSFEYQLHDLEFDYFYGVTDRLSVGVRIPYYWNKNKVTAYLNPTNATVGKNPLVPGGVAPLAIPGTVPFTTGDIQNLLGQEYGFKPVETWSDSGFGDIEAGFRYQYFKTDNWRLAFTGGVRLPSGEVDDPDNLVDIPFGNGAWALLFELNNDYTGIKNTILNITFKYDLYLPDHEVLRVPDDVDQPITPNKEDVDREIADIIEINTSATYQFLKGSSVYLEYLYSHKYKDSISGNQGFAYDQLEAESDYTEHIFRFGLSYSTIPLFQEKKFSVPLTASIFYRNRFAGENASKSQYIQVAISIFF